MYHYDANEDPPAAYVPVQVINPDTGAAMVLSAKYVLNHFILTLDGKSLTFDLKDP